MKKGFTLVEIILSIALITVVGIGATIGFIQYNKNSKEKTLNNMSDEILTALRVYIETDGEAKKRIYEDYEGMAITLNTLESEGLIDFGDLDVQDDYVVAMLSNESDCSDITTVNNWDLSNGPLYICSKSNGSQNLFAVGGDAENLSQATRERYYFRGYDVFNYVQLKGNTSKTYQILYIDKDDSIVLVSDSSFGSIFNGVTQSQTCYGTNAVSGYCNVNDDKLYGAISGSVNSSECKIGGADVLNSGVCLMSYGYKNYSSGSGWQKTYKSFSDEVFAYASTSWAVMTDNFNVLGWLGTNVSATTSNQVSITPPSKYKIRLNTCMKITSGTGDMATPYIIERVNCS